MCKSNAYKMNCALLTTILPCSESLCELCFKGQWEQDLLCNLQNDHVRFLVHKLRISKRWQSVKPSMGPCVTTQVTCPPVTDMETNCPWVFLSWSSGIRAASFSGALRSNGFFNSFFSSPFFTWKTKHLTKNANFITALESFQSRNGYWHWLMPPPRVVLWRLVGVLSGLRTFAPLKETSTYCVQRVFH